MVNNVRNSIPGISTTKVGQWIQSNEYQEMYNMSSKKDKEQLILKLEEISFEKESMQGVSGHWCPFPG